MRGATSGLLLLSVLAAGCGRPESRRAPERVDAAAPQPAAAVPEAAPVAISPSYCVHQRRGDLGAPVHREKGGRGGFVRLAECTRLARIEGDDRWLRVAFPEAEGRTEGWISKRYVMNCEPCAAGGATAAASTAWPPQPRGMCESSGATGREQLSPPVEPSDRAAHGGGARGRAGSRVTIVSYNVWELYDGQGESRYLSHDAHGGSAPAKQYPLRLAAFSRALSTVEADVLVLQEVESAAVACALAARAWPRSGWSCYGARGSASGMPQNLAVATRLEGKARVLQPADRRAAGPRPGLELSLEGTDGLTVTGLHLKSSMGQSAHDDCRNARRRMGMVAALASRYHGWSSVLLLGDFNVDPLDSERALYYRTDDILTHRDWSRLCPSAGGCSLATWRGARGAGSAIDLAFFRGGGRWRPGQVRVLASAPHASRTTLGSDHLPLIVETTR